MLHIHRAGERTSGRGRTRGLRAARSLPNARDVAPGRRRLHAVRIARVAVLVVVTACGARTMLDTTIPDTTEIEPHDACKSASGVRICGGTRPCPPIPAPECPGYGCTDGFDFVADAAANGGICAADLPDLGDTPCYACPDGDECFARSPDDLVCVPADVCDALWDEGIRNVCFYADKSRYDHRVIPPAAADCPGGAAGVLCGGGCGTCNTPPQTTRCTGRSPDRSHGLCALDVEFKEPSAPGAFEPCSLPANGGAPLAWCKLFSGSTCAVFAHSDPIEQAQAKKNAFCISRSMCVSIASVAGIECYDEFGTQIAP